MSITVKYLVLAAYIVRMCLKSSKKQLVTITSTVENVNVNRIVNYNCWAIRHLTLLKRKIFIVLILVISWFIFFFEKEKGIFFIKNVCKKNFETIIVKLFASS